MAQDRTGPGFGPSQDPYDVERREMRNWAEEQAETRRRSGIDGPGVDPSERHRLADGAVIGEFNCFGQINHIHATDRDAVACQAEQSEEAASW